MIRFLADIRNAEILLFQEHARLGKALDTIISVEDGSVLGFLVFDPIQKQKGIIPMSEVRKYTGGVIVVNGYDSITNPADVIRLKDAIEVGAKITGEQVVTESGQKVGKVASAAIDTKGWRLARLYVEPPFGLKFLARELLIPAKQIVKIEKKKIIVRDATQKAAQAEPVTATPTP